MPAWKNITLSLPGKDLRIISDKILFIKRILSATIIDRHPEEKSTRQTAKPDRKNSFNPAPRISHNRIKRFGERY